MRFFCVFLALFLLTGPVCAALDGEIPELSAGGAILMERESGRVLFEQNADKRLPMASTTKVMTALITLERCDLDEVVTASANASGVPGTSIYLGEGEQLSVWQMLMGLMLRSGNDAAVALAEHISGSTGDFVRLMNRRAQELSADASFVTPNGLDAEGHEASVRAMALIADEAMDYPAFRKIVSTREMTIPWRDSPYDRALKNKNKLLWSYEGATGIKTGFTKKAGRCLIFSAERDNMELLGVVLNCGEWFDAAKQLLDWGFNHYKMREFLYAGQEVADAVVTGGIDPSVRIVAPMKLRTAVADNETATLEIETVSTLQAPVKAGDIAGEANVIGDDGEIIARIMLVAEKSVAQRTMATAMHKVIEHFNPVA